MANSKLTTEKNSLQGRRKSGASGSIAPQTLDILHYVLSRGQREDGRPSFSKNWKTPFFSRYSKFL